MKTNKKAITLIEIMIGVVLLILILVPSLNVIIGQTQTVNATRDHSQAALVAARIIEIAKTYPFNKLSMESCEKEEDKKKTFEYKLLHNDVSDNYNVFNLNGIEYKINSENTKLSKIKRKGASDDTAAVAYALKYQIDYKSKDGKEHNLQISTILSMR